MSVISEGGNRVYFSINGKNGLWAGQTTGIIKLDGAFHDPDPIVKLQDVENRGFAEILAGKINSFNQPAKTSVA